MRIWLFRVFVLGALLGVSPVFAAPLFTQLGGIVDIEAEGWSNNIPRNGSFWNTTNAIAAYSGDGFVDALPNSGINRNVSWDGISPELQYAVFFNTPGTYYVWIRGHAIAGTDNSVHAGINGTTNTAAALTLTQTNIWQWTTNRTDISNRATISAAAGEQTFNLWMREDGMRVDRILLTTNINFVATIGNAWHIPSNPEPGAGLSSMRVPLNGISSNTAVTIYTGNQFQGDGNAADQSQSGSRLLYKHVTNTTWSSLPKTFLTEAGNNKYYSSTIPANTFSAGDLVQYYLRIGYTDRLPTFLYGNDDLSLETEFETVAQSDPFTFTVQWPLIPTGEYIAHTNTPSGAEARVYLDSGHIALGTNLTIAPPAVSVAGESTHLGKVRSYVPITSGFELIQDFYGTTVFSRVTFPSIGVMRYEVLDWGAQPIEETAITAASPSDEHFYGFGEKFNSFDQAGKKTHIITDDPPGTKGDKSYKVAPWFISTKGYGFHLDSSAESWFDMRASFADRYVISNLFPSVKFDVVAGPNLTDVLTRYTSFTGRPPLSPPWAFAPWMSTDIWRDGGEIRYMVTKYRERGIPGSVVVFDSPWEIGYNDFIWNTNQFSAGGTYESQFWPGFSTIGDMLTFLRTNGWKVVCWMTPFINNAGVTGEVPGQQTVAANYATALASNYFVRVVNGGVTNTLSASWWKGTGSPVDFTNPDARAWMQSQLSNLVAQSGGVIGGFKTDDGESGNPPGSYIPKNALYHDGRTGEEMQNGYSAEYHKSIWPVLGTNGILFARSGFTTSHAYPGYWSGDNEPNFGTDNGLPSVVRASQSAAMSGYSIWASDIGGYQNSNVSSTPINLFMRWTQFGAFSPLMQMHRQVGANNQYPWSYGDEALTNYIYYAKLHTALFPYIYTYAAESALNGLPIMRPLVLMDGTDTNTHGVQHTYLFGNELLVSAIITNLATSRTVYLPPGTWYDFFTQQAHTGGQNINWVNANQSQMPLFVKQGAIIPMISTNVMTLCDSNYVANPNLPTMDSALECLVYPGTNSSFTMYDGTVFNNATHGGVVMFSLNSMPRAIQLREFMAAPAGVECDGVPLRAYNSQTALNAATSGWWHNATTGFLQVKFQHLGGTADIGAGPDSIGDGLTDSWRFYFFGSGVTTNADSCATCDADGDGIANANEYGAGTSPIDANSLFRIESIAKQLVIGQTNLVLSWSTEKGIQYQIQWSNVLEGNPSWNTLGTVYNGDGTPIFWTDDGTETGSPPTGKRFYRVIVVE